MSNHPTLRLALDRLGAGAPDVLDRVIEEAGFGVYVDHPVAGCIFANRELLRQFGIGWEEFAGFGWARQVHPHDAERLSREIAEYEHSNEAIDVSYRVLRPDHSVGWVHARVHKVFDAAGEHIGSVGVTAEVTENRLLRDQTLRAQRVEAIGRLSARVAHDFNNVLGTILGSASLLRYRAATKLEPEELDHLEEIEGAVAQARAVTNQLLALTQQGVRSAAGSPVDSTLEEMRGLVAGAVGEGVEVVLELAAGDALVPFDAGTLGQIVLNLALNGRDAMRGRGVLRIRTECDGEDSVGIVVMDDGEGIPENLRERVFEPFFTTKEEGRGTGMGLYSVRELVAGVGGRVELDSEVGAGTTVLVVVPRAKKSEAGDELEGNLAEVRGQGRILLVDDNTALRQSLAYALALAGFEVTAAHDLAAGAELLAPNRYDAAVIDVLLPDGHGPELARRAREIQPDLPVVFISGFAGEAGEQIEIDERTEMLQKPFHSAKLARILVRLIDAPNPAEE